MASATVDARAGHGRLEGVEVHHHQVDGLDAVRPHGGHVLGVGRARPAAPPWIARVQRLHPAVHHLGEAGHLADVGHGQPGLAQGLRGAPGREQGHAPRRQGAGELRQAGLVVDGEQRAPDGGGR